MMGRRSSQLCWCAGDGLGALQLLPPLRLVPARPQVRPRARRPKALGWGAVVNRARMGSGCRRRLPCGGARPSKGLRYRGEGTLRRLGFSGTKACCARRRGRGIGWPRLCARLQALDARRLLLLERALPLLRRLVLRLQALEQRLVRLLRRLQLGRQLLELSQTCAARASTIVRRKGEGEGTARVLQLR